MARSETEERVERSLRRAIGAAILANHEIADALGLGPSDAQFLHLLELHGSLTAGRLADLSGLTTGTVTGVIDRLETRGFVRRESDPADRRRVLVTRDEGAIARSIAPRYDMYRAALRKVLSRYRIGDLELLAEFLDAISSPQIADLENRRDQVMADR